MSYVHYLVRSILIGSKQFPSYQASKDACKEYADNEEKLNSFLKRHDINFPGDFAKKEVEFRKFGKLGENIFKKEADDLGEILKDQSFLFDRYMNLDLEFQNEVKEKLFNGSYEEMLKTFSAMNSVLTQDMREGLLSFAELVDII